jgi:hypothetical protein
MVNSLGLMVDAIRVNGKMESKMEKECIVTRRVLRDLEFGRMERR